MNLYKTNWAAHFLAPDNTCFKDITYFKVKKKGTCEIQSSNVKLHWNANFNVIFKILF